jgi:hypothetical protein
VSLFGKDLLFKKQSMFEIKNTSVEELEERPTANWIRRQLQHFAQARRDVCLIDFC